MAETSVRSAAAASPTLAQALAAARSGLRRDVERLLAALVDGELILPLTRDLPEVPEGETTTIDGELRVSPHLLPAADGDLFAALFSDLALLEPIVEKLGWGTDGGPLKICLLPARTALDVALALIDEANVLGLVVDPGGASELCLSRSELASLLAGQPVPLVAYVGDIPREEVEKTLVAAAGEPPPAELVDALSACLGGRPDVEGHSLLRTFNPDRDREPHLTLSVRVREGADRAELYRAVTASCEGKLPPPGYLDVLFE